MKTVEIDEATSPMVYYAEQAAEEPLLITRDGRPVAVVVHVDAPDVESLALSNDPAFIAIIEEARESYRRRGGTTSEDLREELGIGPALKSKASKKAS